jgi:ATP-dependent DNA helicase RecG
VELLHGRMPSKQKDRIMQQFAAGTVQLLVATTVIEVGVDVANASLMVIENAERMGLAQLHQLRGRVGRGQQESSCVLLYRAPLSQMAQTGLAQLRVADLARDADLLDEVRATANQMLQAMPERVAALRIRWIGEREQYGRVG